MGWDDDSNLEAERDARETEEAIRQRWPAGAEDVETVLSECLDFGRFDEDGVTGADLIKSVRTFEQVGMLTRDRGLVLTFDDGSEYQVTIVRSQ